MQKEHNRTFADRHIGPSAVDRNKMLEQLQLVHLNELVKQTVPAGILGQKNLDLPKALSENEALLELKNLASKNKIYKSQIGMGYSASILPTVILRNVLENPGWYTAYTPYQAEISQGRLEALLNFQTMIMDLTAMPVANASLLDEATAAAEGMHLAHSACKSPRNKFFVDHQVHPQTLEVLQTRATPLGLELVISDPTTFVCTEEFFGALLQYPNTEGAILNYAQFTSSAHACGALVIVATDLLSLTLLKPPGEWGADVVIGSAQRFGVPMGFGGPHAAFFATQERFKRDLPGRIVGVSVDATGKPALRLALQTREQHIRREKATSNICTAQVLLAVISSFYAIYHGAEGLVAIAKRVRKMAHDFAREMQTLGFAIGEEPFFDCVKITLERETCKRVMQAASAAQINLRKKSESCITISFDETCDESSVQKLLTVLRNFAPAQKSAKPIGSEELPAWAVRSSSFLQENVFNIYQSETEMLRYIFRLQSRDLSLAHSMIPLGSCTMKLNATTEMIPVTFAEFANIHPFAPRDQAQGYLQLIHELEKSLAEMTGFAAVSLQPNAGSQGEYAGLLCIRAFHQSRKEGHRKICLIPSSAHGTNPASAVMAGMQVVVVQCDSQGNVDLADLKKQALLHKENLAALMITYPSTHGVFEEDIAQICQAVHEYGGQVYMDGANFNAMVGLCRPGDFGPDVCHLNLHKTFCIPHGGGGPGVGPIGVRSHLAAFLPGKELDANGLTAPAKNCGMVSASPFGSASILPISWTYIRMMGEEGLKMATEVAILNANYIASRLSKHFPILYTGKQGRVAHECIIDLRQFKTITVEDVAKRLMDYGFHAPTMSWPVAGTLMIEPTESESLAEIDRFCDSMIAIRAEIEKVEKGEWPKDNNPLKSAPHTAFVIASDDWKMAYSRQTAAFPLPWTRDRKFWPFVSRINNPYGDRNLVCSCAPLESYQS